MKRKLFKVYKSNLPPASCLVCCMFALLSPLVSCSIFPAVYVSSVYCFTFSFVSSCRLALFFILSHDVTSVSAFYLRLSLIQYFFLCTPFLLLFDSCFFYFLLSTTISSFLLICFTFLVTVVSSSTAFYLFLSTAATTVYLLRFSAEHIFIYTELFEYNSCSYFLPKKNFLYGEIDPSNCKKKK